jgi:hypothetical protein
LWLEAHLGDEFKKAMAQAGGLREGIILKKICDPGGLSTVMIDDVSCFLHAGKATGLGEFIRNWTQSKDPEHDEKLAQAHVVIIEEFLEIFKKRVTGDAEAAYYAKKTTDRLIPILEAAIGVVKDFYASRMGTLSRGSSSGSDNSNANSTQEAKMAIAEKGISDFTKFMHEQDLLFQTIKELLPGIATIRKELKKEFFALNIPTSDHASLHRMRDFVAALKGHKAEDIIEDIRKMIQDYRTPEQALMEKVSAQAKEISAQAKENLALTKENLALHARIAHLKETATPPEERVMPDSSLQSPLIPAPPLTFTSSPLPSEKKRVREESKDEKGSPPSSPFS